MSTCHVHRTLACTRSIIEILVMDHGDGCMHEDSRRAVESTGTEVAKRSAHRNVQCTGRTGQYHAVNSVANSPCWRPVPYSSSWRNRQGLPLRFRRIRERAGLPLGTRANSVLREFHFASSLEFERERVGPFAKWQPCPHCCGS